MDNYIHSDARAMYRRLAIKLVALKLFEFLVSAISGVLILNA